jgi:hypothetical protein
MSDQDKDVEILALRHQIAVLERQLGTIRPRFSPADRAFLAALLPRLPRDVLGRFRLLVRPETVLRWHRDVLARATRPGPAPGARVGRAPSAPSASWCCAWQERIPAGATAASTVQACRHELLDRTLIWNQRHLLHSLREFEHFYNEHRRHRTLRAAAPLRPLPEPITDPERIAHLDVRRGDRLGGTLHEHRHAALPARMNNRHAYRSAPTPGGASASDFHAA